MTHPVYTSEYAEGVKPRHKVPEQVCSGLFPLLLSAVHLEF